MIVIILPELSPNISLVASPYMKKHGNVISNPFTAFFCRNVILSQ